MSYHYSYTQGNPEGTDFAIMLKSETAYTSDEFTAITESVLLRFYKGTNPRFIEPDYSFLVKAFSDAGFTVESPFHQTYYLEPYWDRKSIVSEELRTIMDDVNKHDDDDDDIDPQLVDNK